MSVNPPPTTGMLSHQSAVTRDSNYWCRDCGSDVKNVSTLIAKDIFADNVATDFLFSFSTIFETSFSFSTLFDVAYGNFLSSGSAYIDIYNGEEMTVSSISTNVIDLDGNFLNTAGGDELLLNGIPIATTANLSSIGDWALFPAVSSIQPAADRTQDVGQSTNRFRVGYFSSLVAEEVIVLSTTLTLVEVVSSLFVDYQFASTLDADLGRFSVMTVLDGSFDNLNASTAQISTLTNNYLDSVSANISSLNAQQIVCSSIAGNVGTFSTVNGQVGNFSTLIAPSGSVSTFVVNNGTFSTINAQRGNISSLSALDASISSLNGEIFLASTLRARVAEASTLRGAQTFVSTIDGNRATFSNGQITRLNGTRLDYTDIFGRGGRFSTINVNPIGGTITTSNITSSNILGSNTVNALGQMNAPLMNASTRLTSPLGQLTNIQNTTLYGRNGFFSSIFTSSVTASTTNTRVANISTLVASNALVSRYTGAQMIVLGQANITTGIFSSITTSTINVTNPSDNTSNWANFPALSNVNMNGSNLSNANTITGATGNFTTLNTSNLNTSNITASNTIGAGTLNATTGNITTLNASNVNASNGYFSNVLSNGGGILANGGLTVGPAGLFASINSIGDGYMRNLDVGDQFTQFGDLNVYGANNIPFDNALYVEGGVQFDGGFIHGFNAGCGPVGVPPFAVNTTRIDMTIAGIGLTAGQGFITQQALGAVAIQAGGAASLAAGGAVSIAAGDYIEMNAQNVKLNNAGCQLRFNANTGAGDPGGLPLGANGSNDLTLNGLPFGVMAVYNQGVQTYTIDDTTTNSNIATYDLPSLGQWRIKQTVLVSTVSGNPKEANVQLWYSPSQYAPLSTSVWNQSVFAPAVVDIVNHPITVEGTLTLSTTSGIITSSIFSTINQSTFSFVSTFISSVVNPSPPPPYLDVSTFSTIYYTSSYTSSIFSTIYNGGGLKLWCDATDAANNFTAELVLGDLLATYLGRTIV